MLLTNRRHRLLFIALAGMEVAWLLPFVMLLLARWQAAMLGDPVRSDGARGLDLILGLSPLAAFLLFTAIMLLYMLMTDLLNTRLVDSPQRELVLLGVVLATMLWSVRLLLYPNVGLSNLSWVAQIWRSIFDFTEGRRAELALVLINLLLWLRVILASSRDLSFFSVGVSFRLGLLLTLLGNALLTSMTTQPVAVAIHYFWLFLACGLVAVALARVDEKALIGEHSTGALMPWSRIGLVGGTVALTLGSALLLARLYTPENIRVVLAWFAPLWLAIGWLLLRILTIFVWLVSPLMEWIIAYFQSLELEIPQRSMAQGELLPGDTEYVSIANLVQNFAVLRYCLVVGVIVIVLGLLWLFFIRTARQPRGDEAEEMNATGLDLGGNPFRRGLDRLRDLANLLRQYGLSNQLLDAITVQNLYANLTRIARQRGYPRLPSQPPDEYVPRLMRAFPAHEGALARITNAYMRVHYGDHPVTAEELEQLRADYERLQEADVVVGNVEKSS